MDKSHHFHLTKKWGTAKHSVDTKYVQYSREIPVSEEVAIDRIICTVGTAIPIR